MSAEKEKKRKNLRKGFTTGTTASAAALSAYNFLTGQITEKNGMQDVSLPADKTLKIPYRIISSSGGSVISEVIKDAGDDPDITDKIVLRAEVCYADESAAVPEDYIIKCGFGKIILNCSGGIGLVTRPGLDAEQGKWAVNSVPRRMIGLNLESAGFGGKDEILKVSLSAVNGEKIAEKTLNGMLGVKGGISILGTTGIVVPYSNAAYRDTLKIQFRTLSAEGKREIILATGNRTKQFFLRDFPEFSSAAAVRIGDFIGASMEFTGECGYRKVYIACMAGKLYKYACGLKYTHAHKAALTFDLLLAEMRKMNLSSEIIEKAADCASISEVGGVLDGEIFLRLLKIFASYASDNLKKWNNGVSEIVLYVYSNTGECLCIQSSGEKKEKYNGEQ